MYLGSHSEVPLMTFAVLKRASLSLQMTMMKSNPTNSSTTRALMGTNVRACLFRHGLSGTGPYNNTVPLYVISRFSLPPDVVSHQIQGVGVVSPSGVRIGVNDALGSSRCVNVYHHRIVSNFVHSHTTGLNTGLVGNAICTLSLPGSDGRPCALRCARRHRSNLINSGGSLRISLIVKTSNTGSHVTGTVSTNSCGCTVTFRRHVHLPRSGVTCCRSLTRVCINGSISPSFCT